MTRQRSLLEKSASRARGPVELRPDDPCVELIRVSTMAQAAKDTPADQRRALDDLRARIGGRIVETIDYGAAGLSGFNALADRPDLRRLAEVVKAKHIRQIRVRFFNRLCRANDLQERTAVLAIAASAGAVFVEADGTVTDPSTDMGELTGYLKLLFSSIDGREIAKKTLDGRIDGIRNGEIVIRQPWGRTWDRASRSWRADDRIMGILRRAALAVLDGQSAGSVAAAFNREGVSSPRGRAWTGSMLVKILRRPHMIGRMPDGIGGERTDLPPVLDESTWRRVCDRLTANRGLSGPPRVVPALLRGIARCGVCGAPMYPHTARWEGKPYRYYRCSSALRRTPGLRLAAAEDCRIGHPLDAIDREIAAWIEVLASDPATLMRAVKVGKPGPDSRLDPVKAQREIDRASARAVHVTRLVTTGQITETEAAVVFGEIKAARAAAEATLNAARAQAAARERSAAQASRVEDVARAILGRARAGGFAAMRAAIGLLFPADDPRCSLRILPDGTVDGVALISLDPGAAPPPEGSGSPEKPRKSASSIRAARHEGRKGSNKPEPPDRPLADVIPLRFKIKP